MNKLTFDASQLRQQFLVSYCDDGAAGKLIILNTYRPVLEVVGMVSLLVLFSYGFDVLYILITRWMLRSVSQIRRLDVIVFLVVLDVVLAIILVYGPIELMTALTKPYLLGTAGVYLLLLVMFNIGDFIACSVFFLLMVSVFAYRLVWPILERPIYALHRYGVIRRKKLLWAVAIALFVGPDTFVALIKYIVQHV